MSWFLSATSYTIYSFVPGIRKTTKCPGRQHSCGGTMKWDASGLWKLTCPFTFGLDMQAAPRQENHLLSMAAGHTCTAYLHCFKKSNDNVLPFVLNFFFKFYRLNIVNPQAIVISFFSNLNGITTIYWTISSKLQLIMHEFARITKELFPAKFH